MSSYTHDPDKHKFQKAVFGEKEFTFELQDYFKKDVD